MRPLTLTLTQWLDQGGAVMGQIAIRRAGEGFSLCHQDDLSRDDLEEFRGPENARQLSSLDDTGEYRPLKTAPNLRHGWRLSLPDAEALHIALDHFYPAMLGIWRSHREGKLTAIPFRETLARQSGMYAVTRKITDVQADAMIGDFCRTSDGCLKRILWKVDSDAPIHSLPADKFKASAIPEEMPLLCHEACNLLVARAREVVKKGEYAP